jgi:hypothetical protein
MKKYNIIKSYSKHFRLDEKKVREAVKIAQAINKEWDKRLINGLSEEEYDIIEGILIKYIAKKRKK